MLQIADLRGLEAKDIEQLLDKVTPILNKRKSLHNRYCRNASGSKVMYYGDKDNTVVPFEKFIVDLATGYLSGKPTYGVADVTDEGKAEVLSRLFEKEIKDENYKNEMALVMNYVSGYNDDETENHELIHDILELTSCYEILYENENNEIVYSKYDPLQTVATWDYQIPPNLTGIVRTWKETDLAGNEIEKVELTDYRGTRTFNRKNKQEITEEDNVNHEWGDVPAFAVENDTAIFEVCEDVIQAYEQLVQNTRNTYQYNDSDCKMKITGYTPENPMTIENEEGNTVANPARITEDQFWLDAKTIYVTEGGDVEWLIKPVDSNGVTTILKTYVDLMFQLAGIPNTSDLAFNSADLNASAIDRKFYVMNMATQSINEKLKKAYLRRWELIFNRINLKKGTKYDFRDISIELPKNLPANNDEIVDSMMKLQGMISNQTIVEKLGYNYLEEKAKKDEETQEGMQKQIEMQQTMQNAGLMGVADEQATDDTEAMEENRPNA